MFVMSPVWKSARVMPKSSLKVASQLAIIILVFGLAECASENNALRQRGSFTKKINTKSSRGSSSCLSYGHSCWGAHGKRSGVASSEPPGIDVAGISAALQQASPEDTRWLLSKLIGTRLAAPPKPRSNKSGWQRQDTSLKDVADPQSNEMRDSGISRSDTINLEAEDGEFRLGGEEGQDSAPEGDELLVMASPAEEAQINRGAQKLRLYKIMNRAFSKNLN